MPYSSLLIDTLLQRARPGVALLALLVCQQALGEPVPRADIDAWLADTVTADAPPSGTVFTRADIAALRPWIPPGYFDEFLFDEVRVEIQERGDFSPPAVYRETTARHAGQARIAADGALENYVAGLPFSHEQIAAADPRSGGFMVAWNRVHRWQHMGYRVDALTMTYLRPGDSGPLAPDMGLHGGGLVTRTLTQYYHRVYLSNLAWLGDQDYRVDVADSDTRFFKDYMAFLDPFDVKGTSFVVERHLDAYEEDQVNIYSPTERRVRRVSAKERADSFMGSEGTMDDFEGFSGRVLDYEWTYLGRRSVLQVADTAHEVAQAFGPYSRVPDDRWQVRDCYVVEVRSTWEDHPYRERIMFVDVQSFTVALSLIVNHDGMLWKTIHTVTRAPRGSGDDRPLEESVASWRGSFITDLQSNNATVVRALTPTEHPALKPSQIKRVFSVSNLSSGR